MLYLAVSGCAAWRSPPVAPAPPDAEPAALPIPPAPVVPPGVGPVAAPVAPRQTGRLSDDEILGLQVGLDRLNFSPGSLDGRWGPQTRMALEAWQEAMGESVTGIATDEVVAKLAPAEPLTSYTVTKEDHEELTVAPISWRGRAETPRLGYETILELVGERFHVSPACLRRLNPAAAWPDPPAGAALVAPDTAAASPLRAARLDIDLERKFVRAYDAQGKLMAHFPCSIARLKEKRPQGETTVANAAENPVYTFDPALFTEDPEARGIAGKLILQAGPNNPVGAAWVGLALPGYGVHGTPWPEDIGKTESHGCIRLANWNVRKLVRMVRQGTPVRFAVPVTTGP